MILTCVWNISFALQTSIVMLVPMYVKKWKRSVRTENKYGKFLIVGFQRTFKSIVEEICIELIASD